MTGPQRYETIKQLWRVESMHTFKDYLVYYNNQDMKPFVDANLSNKICLGGRALYFLVITKLVSQHYVHQMARPPREKHNKIN